MKALKQFLALILLSIFLVTFASCATKSIKTVELSHITQDQAVNLQKSHVQFVQRYYQKLREEVNAFLETEWIPLFLSKAVNNESFRKDLDESYLLASIKESDLQIRWKGNELFEPQKSAIQSNVKRIVTEERGRLGEVLLNFAESAQIEINAKRKELMNPINDQEKMVVNEINAAWGDLISGQAAVTAHLESVVEVKKSQNEVLRKLNILEKRDKMLDVLMQYNDMFTNLLKEKEDAEKKIEKYKNKFTELEKELKNSQK